MGGTGMFMTVVMAISVTQQNGPRTLMKHTRSTVMTKDYSNYSTMCHLRQTRFPALSLLNTVSATSFSHGIMPPRARWGSVGWQLKLSAALEHKATLIWQHIYSCSFQKLAGFFLCNVN